MVKPKAGAKHELLFNKLAVEHARLIKPDQIITTKCDQNNKSNIYQFGHT
jgi:hypothetical protein